MSVPSFEDTFDKLIANIKQLQDRSDAGYALVGAAILDGEMEKVLRARMKTAKEGLCNKLLNDLGPLANTAARMDVCCALGFISESAYYDLRLINKIRVKFAHSDHIRTFSYMDVLDLMKKISSYKEDLAQDHRTTYSNILKRLSSNIRRFSADAGVTIPAS